MSSAPTCLLDGHNFVAFCLAPSAVSSITYLRFGMLGTMSQKVCFYGIWCFLFILCRFHQSGNSIANLSLLGHSEQRCGAGTRISGPASRHLNFLATEPASRIFWLRLQNGLLHWKPLYYLYNSFAPQSWAVKPEPKISGSGSTT